MTTSVTEQLVESVRLTAAIPPVSPHLSAGIRLYVNRFATLAQLVESDTLNGPAAALLRCLVEPTNAAENHPTADGRRRTAAQTQVELP
ncbi:MAG: hypothetical protein ABR540_11285 [Acidimicrobiales bacterium]